VYHASKDPLPRYSPDRLLLDSKSRNTIVNSTNLFEYAILGYIFGLMSAFYIGSISGHAQPALIYLVPGVLIPVSLRAYRKGCLLEVSCIYIYTYIYLYTYMYILINFYFLIYIIFLESAYYVYLPYFMIYIMTSFMIFFLIFFMIFFRYGTGLRRQKNKRTKKSIS
jgi:hypothetical protein